MITAEELDLYIKQEGSVGGEKAMCWRCRKSLNSINESHTVIEKAVYDKKKSVWRYFLYFHEKCFMEVAGTNYTMEPLIDHPRPNG